MSACRVVEDSGKYIDNVIEIFMSQSPKPLSIWEVFVVDGNVGNEFSELW